MYLCNNLPVNTRLQLSESPDYLSVLSILNYNEVGLRGGNSKPSSQGSQVCDNPLFSLAPVSTKPSTEYPLSGRSCDPDLPNVTVRRDIGQCAKNRPGFVRPGLTGCCLRAAGSQDWWWHRHDVRDLLFMTKGLQLDS